MDSCHSEKALPAHKNIHGSDHKQFGKPDSPAHPHKIRAAARLREQKMCCILREFMASAYGSQPQGHGHED